MVDTLEELSTPARRRVIKSIGGVGLGTILSSGSASAQSNGVELTIVEFKPNTIDGNDIIHTLKFKISNISTDGDETNSKDAIKISLPNCIRVTSATYRRTGPFEPKPDSLVASNPITFTVDPSSPVNDPVEMAIDLKLSPTNGCSGDGSTENNSDPPGCPDLPLSFTSKRFEFTAFENITDFPPLSVKVPSNYVDRAFARQATTSKRFVGVQFPPAFNDRGDYEVGFQITAGFFDTIDEVVQFNDFNNYTEVTDQFNRSDDARIFDNTNGENTLNMVYNTPNGVDRARVTIVPSDFNYFEDPDCPNGAQSVYRKAVNTLGPAD